MESAKASLVTCSFSGDFDVFGILSQSIDRFVPKDIEHLVYVPARDVPMFSRFANSRRTILPQEDLLPSWFWKAPLPGPEWRARLGLPRRNVYLTPYSLPVRGWIAQQIMKISASLRAETDIVAHVDSDIAFVRPLQYDHLIQNGQVRFHAQRADAALAAQTPWYAAASRLLGLPSADYSDTLYIDQFVVWRRTIVADLVAKIEKTTGRDWRVALARSPQFSEYILYGMFVDHVTGSGGLFEAPGSLCHSLWSGGFAGAEEEDAFISRLQPDHVACLIQSTIPMALEDRVRVFASATRKASESARRAA